MKAVALGAFVYVTSTAASKAPSATAFTFRARPCAGDQRQKKKPKFPCCGQTGAGGRGLLARTDLGAVADSAADVVSAMAGSSESVFTDSSRFDSC